MNPLFRYLNLFLICIIAINTNCVNDERNLSDTLSIDLIPLYIAAKQMSDTGYMNADSEYSVFYFDFGWQNRKSIILAVSPKSTIRYNVYKRAWRFLHFNVGLPESYGNIDRQQILISTKSKLIKSIRLLKGESIDVVLPIPPALQSIGENSLHFTFEHFPSSPEEISDYVDRNRYSGLGIASYFKNFKMYLSDNRHSTGKWISDSDNMFSLVANGTALMQKCNSSISYSFKINKNSSITLEGTVIRSNGHQAEENILISLELRSEGNPKWRNIYTQRVSSVISTDHKITANVQIPSEDNNNIVEFMIEVKSSALYSDSHIVWKKLKLFSSQRSATLKQDDTVVAAPISVDIDHVIIVVLDAARADHFGFLGNKLGLTPHTDKLAKSSIVFTNAVAPAPHTRASVPSLFTGLNSERHGMYTNGEVLPDDIDNIGKAFKRKGFLTINLSGSWAVDPRQGLWLGYDKSFVLAQRFPNRPFRPQNLKKMEEGLEYAANCGERTFIYMHFLPPHWPYNPPKPFNTKHTSTEFVNNHLEVMARLRYKQITANHPDVIQQHMHYMNNVSYADHIVGRIIAILKKLDIFDRTLIVITADHGEAFGEHGRLAHGSVVYEETIRVPLVMKIPGIEHRVIEQQVGVIDLFPTLANICDITIDYKSINGRSLLKQILNEKHVEDNYYFIGRGGGIMILALRGNKYKYVNHLYKEELFNIKSDPMEEVDISLRRPVLSAFMRQIAMTEFYSNPIKKRIYRIQLSEEDKQELRNLGYLQ